MGEPGSHRDARPLDRPRRVRPVGRALLLIGATLIGLLIAEAGIRLVGVAPDVKPIWVSSDRFVYKRSDNPLLSFEIRPDYRNDDPDYFQTYESTNAWGQRDRERTLERTAGVRRVLLLGDSVVEGTGLRAHATLSRQLEELWPDGSTEVLNFGVSGYCTLAEVEALAVKGLRFSPDAVVLVFVENDFENFNAEAFQLATEIERPAWVEQAFLRSELFRVAALRFDLWGFGSEQDPMRWNQRAIGDNNVVEGLRRFRVLAEEHGFQPLVAIWPRFENTAVVDLPPMPDDPQHLVIEQLGAMYGLPTLRLSAVFENDLTTRPGPANPRALYTIGDRMRPSAEGARIAAAGLGPAIEALLAATELPRPDSTDAAAIAAAQAVGSMGEPNYARVHTRLGNLAYDDGRLEQAEVHYRDALAEDPESVEALLNLGLLLRTQRRLDEAAEAFRDALRLDPDEGRAWYGLGRVFVEDGQPDRAQESFLSALRARPGYADAHFALGTLRQRGGDPRGALVAWNAAVEGDPAHVAALNNIGRALEAQNDLEGAAGYYERAVAADPAAVEVWINLGIVRAVQGRSDEAEAALGAAVAADPGHAKARFNLAEVLRRQGRDREAASELQAAVEIDRDYYQAWLQLGDLLAGVGDHRGARAAWQAALEGARGAGRDDLIERIAQRLDGDSG